MITMEEDHDRGINGKDLSFTWLELSCKFMALLSCPREVILLLSQLIITVIYNKGNS